MNKKTLARIISLLLPVIILTGLLFKENILYLTRYFWPCTFYNLTHLYCPGCGNTRSVTALLHGEFAVSLRFNIVPFLSLILVSLGYIELATYSFGKKVQLLPRKLSFYLILIFLLVVYWITRNFSPYLTP